MTQQDHLATIRVKQDRAASACQRATLLLQQNPDADTLDQIAASLSEVQAAVAVIAHCLEAAESLSVSAPEQTESIPIPPEPLEAVVTPAYEPSAATTATVAEPAIEEAIEEAAATIPEGNHSPSSGPSLLEKLNDSPLESIQMALSINDRVRFSAVLALGDMKRFNQLCAAVDTAANLEEALHSVQSSCSHITTWDDEEEAPFEFIHRVHRVFA
ncbi:MAG TPA: hypothetical protein DCX00_02930 [Flavobacteriales bacterium]|nr:hypothetical protein [Flavobacteriales bacterium]